LPRQSWLKSCTLAQPAEKSTGGGVAAEKQEVKKEKGDQHPSPSTRDRGGKTTDSKERVGQSSLMGKKS